MYHMCPYRESERERLRYATERARERASVSKRQRLSARESIRQHTSETEVCHGESARARERALLHEHSCKRGDADVGGYQAMLHYAVRYALT
jgi:hypothetical protein